MSEQNLALDLLLSVAQAIPASRRKHYEAHFIQLAGLLQLTKESLVGSFYLTRRARRWGYVVKTVSFGPRPPETTGMLSLTQAARLLDLDHKKLSSYLRKCDEGHWYTPRGPYETNGIKETRSVARYEVESPSSNPLGSRNVTQVVSKRVLSKLKGRGEVAR